MTTSPSTQQQMSSQQSEGKVRLTGQGLVSASCGEENHFTIDGSAAPEGGKPEVQISSQKTSLNVKLKNVGYNLYQAFYSPRTPGTYLLYVLWSGRQVKGCPLKVIAEDNRGTNRAVSVSRINLYINILIIFAFNAYSVLQSRTFLFLGNLLRRWAKNRNTGQRYQKFH